MNGIFLNETLGPIKLKRSIFYWVVAALLDRNRVESISFADEAVLFTSGARDAKLPILEIGKITARRRLLWSDLEIVGDQQSFRLVGLSSRTAYLIQSLAESARFTFVERTFSAYSTKLDSLYARVRDYGDPRRFLSSYRHSLVVADAMALSERFPKRFPERLLSSQNCQRMETIRFFLNNDQAIRGCGNSVFKTQELIRSKAFFDRFEKQPLTEEQRRAIVTDEDRNLVVAAAGSGKTSVIAAKAAWLIKKGYVSPSELLVLAFAKDARGELEARLTSRMGQAESKDISVRTFHGLGTNIIAKVDGKVPSLSRTAEDKNALQQLLKSFLRDLVIQESFRPIIEAWFQSYFAPYRSPMEFQNLGEYWAYIKTYEIRSLNGELVKSYEECEIANFLLLQGIDYVYEHPYEIETSTSSKRQYKPDFYLPDYDIYIEHFAIDADGRTPSFINQEDYIRSMEWKRRLHEQNDTILVETFSYEKQLGGNALTNRLMEKLRALSVVPSPIPPEEVFKKLSEQGRVDGFTRLIQTFLKHFKGSQISKEDLLLRAENSRHRLRSIAFVEVFSAVYDLYEGYLATEKEIDFEDMISLATQYVEQGKFRNPFSYIVIDEFQDISTGRARLIQGLLDQRADAQLFAVGDDWQSIYRFTGSDTSIMRDFPRIFHPCERVDLTTTFRCMDRIASVAAQFVTRNPSQLQKQFRAVNHAEGECVFVGFPAEPNADMVSETLKWIELEAVEHQSKPKVIILGRYKFSCPKNLHDLQSRFSSLDIEFQTVHKSKGQEADYIIVVELSSGKHGFPSEIEDDPVLDLVLAEPEQHPNAEERRLFYVALTRAKKKVFLLAGRSTSKFLNEMVGEDYGVSTFGRQVEKDASCPVCVDGHMILHKGKRGTFYGCSNFPYCNHTQPVCPECDKGRFKMESNRFVCTECGHTLELCPKCKTGQLRMRKGKYGMFWGCSNYSNHPRCEYTRSAL
jgi:DNA helicase-4